jgi:hypothetical protein
MATETSNIDDLLMGAKTNTMPETPEHDAQNDTALEQNDYDVGDNDSDPDDAPDDTPDLASSEEMPHVAEVDDYGNEKEAPRTYSQEEVDEKINKAIRDRLSRMKTQEQGLPSVQQVQQAQDGFNYNENAEGNWEQQLESFIERTFTKVNQRQATEAQTRKEREAHAEFEDKFTNGMERFRDFRDVVGVQPITDPMTLALRGMKDPAAFVYAASKRHPQELQRISGIADPYAQMVEMGKLEERMRKSASGTNAPRPVSRSKEDTGMPQSKKKEGDSIEDLIAKADTKRRAQLTARRGRG